MSAEKGKRSVYWYVWWIVPLFGFVMYVLL
jgi:hypothetical protein